VSSDDALATLVVLHPFDPDMVDQYSEIAATGKTAQLIRAVRAAHGRVKEIGDGKRLLSLEEIRRELRKVKGAAVLFISSHGETHPDRPDHYTEGVTARDKESLQNKEVLTRDILAALPKNYHAVYDCACYAGAAVDAAQQVLPKGTFFFTSVDAANPSSDAVTGFLTTAITYYGLQGKENNPLRLSDMYLDQLLVQYQHYQLPPRSNEAPLEGIPYRIAVGKEDVVDLVQKVQDLRGHHFSEEEIQRICGRLDNAMYSLALLRVDVRNPGKETADRYALPVSDIVHGVLRKIESGTMRPDDPEYVYALAAAFASTRAQEDPAITPTKLAVEEVPPHAHEMVKPSEICRNRRLSSAKCILQR
jgi:hypothetical protein